MSYFTDDNAGSNQTASGTENSQNTQDQNQEDWVAKVVAEKGDRFSSPQELAKSVLNGGTHIQNLERQIAELKEDLSKQEYAKTLLDQIKEQGKPAGGEASTLSQSTTNTSTSNGDTTQGVSEDVLKGLIEATLVEREATNTATQNLQATDAKLKELYGTEVAAKMNEVSQSLGVSKEYMQEIASKSPTAFFKLVGEDVKTKVPSVPQGTLNTSTSFMNESTSERNWAYYQKLRRENSKLYYTPKIQNQLLADKVRLGDKF